MMDGLTGSSGDMEGSFFANNVIESFEEENFSLLLPSYLTSDDRDRLKKS